MSISFKSHLNMIFVRNSGGNNAKISKSHNNLLLLYEKNKNNINKITYILVDGFQFIN